MPLPRAILLLTAYLAWLTVTRGWSQTPLGATAMRQGNAVSAGMAGAHGGLTGHTAALWNNIGAAAFMSKSEASFGAAFVAPYTTFLAETPSLYLDTTERAFSSPLYFSGVAPVKFNQKPPRVTLGLILDNPFWTTTRWPEGWKGRLISEEYAIRTIVLSPYLAFRISQRLGVGAGIMLGAGSWYDKRSLQLSGVNGLNSFSEHGGGGSGSGYRLGAAYQASEHFSMGFTWRSPLKLAINAGEARFTVPSSLASEYPGLQFSSQLSFPGIWTGGITYTPSTRFRINLDLEGYLWKEVSRTFLTYERQTLFVRNRDTDLGLRNTLGFRFGWEYKSSERLSLRTGFGFLPTATASTQLSPAFPDANRIQIATGASWRLYRRIFLDTALWFEFTGERTAILVNSGFGGVYSTVVTGFIAGFRFGN